MQSRLGDARRAGGRQVNLKERDGFVIAPFTVPIATSAAKLTCAPAARVRPRLLQRRSNGKTRQHRCTFVLAATARGCDAAGGCGRQVPARRLHDRAGSGLQPPRRVPVRVQDAPRQPLPRLLRVQGGAGPRRLLPSLPRMSGVGWGPLVWQRCRAERETWHAFEIILDGLSCAAAESA